MALEQLHQIPSCPQTSALSHDYDVAIVGGGIVGLTLACALKDTGLRLVVIEAKTQSVAVAREQAYSVSVLSSRIFQGIGIWDKILPQIATYSQIRLSDANYPGVVHFRPKDLGTDTLGYVAEHRALLTELQRFLQDCSNVSWLCPAEVIGTQYDTARFKLEVTIGGESQTIFTQLLVGADGANSRIRTEAGIRTHGWKYWQSCIATTVKPEKTHDNIAYERFWSSGPFGILPLPENRCRIVWTAPHEEAQALAALDDEQFLTELQRRYGDQMGQLKLEGDRFVFPVQLMQSDRYTLPRLALIGDAAHCCHPVGGQGLNMGIRDAAALAQVLQSAHNQNEDVGDVAVLRRYERWRQQENLAILGFTDFLNRMFSNNWLPIVIVRRLGLLMLQWLSPMKTFALQLMTGLRGRTPQLGQR